MINSFLILLLLSMVPNVFANTSEEIELIKNIRSESKDSDERHVAFECQNKKNQELMRLLTSLEEKLELQLKSNEKLSSSFLKSRGDWNDLLKSHDKFAKRYQFNFSTGPDKTVFYLKSKFKLIESQILVLDD